MKQDFIQPRFDGGDRFQEHTLPLEVAGDLIAYEELVKELAKKLYRDDHPKRKRAPNGFDSEFSLQLADVEPGSAKPLLALVAAAHLTNPLAAESLPYLEQARDLVTECIAAPAGQLPAKFPKEYLKYFNRIGRSLEAGEVMELTQQSDNAVVQLTPERRKTLVLEVQRLYEKEFLFSGVVSDLHFEKRQLDLRTEDGLLLTAFPYEQELEGTVRAHAGKNRSLFTIEGVGQFDPHDVLKKILKVETLEVQKNYQLSRRLEEIASWQDGWIDGMGVAPEQQALEAFAGELVESYPDDLALPGITLSPDGELIMEWHSPAEAVLDVDLAANKGEFQSFTSPAERVLDFSSDRGWSELYKLLAQTIS